ncbi:response regulator transcription factor [Nesterenkonia alkaliphila]|uniref:Response regulator n=1 Tax=Nesterenkonia alkaliphila TaxID=1463631 RepID=A0A7K1UKQ9_9MICC|nr:response regulator transcription factor [Nesterenkonia alkaliphila]MVT27049.1 response regulator [Nesterenkonia alkaliphila]GFZ93881.1 putative sensory transduction protein [Nesterenkonia alkaliphila]
MSSATAVEESTVLVVDDEKPLADLVGTYLEQDGFSVLVSDNGQDAVYQAREQNPAVVILDLGLPGIDGVEVCRQIRTFSDCYVVMLTARVDEVDRLIGLAVGADDYVVKPFSPRELVARVRAMLRRPRRLSISYPSVIDVGELRVDFTGREVQLSEAPVQLTPTEFDVLAVLASDPNRAFSRRELINEVWGQDWIGDEHLVDVHIGHLRRKLQDDPADPRFIRTVRAVGYKMGTG